MTLERNDWSDRDHGKHHVEPHYHEEHRALIDCISPSDWAAHRSHVSRERLIADEHLLLSAVFSSYLAHHSFSSNRERLRQYAHGEAGFHRPCGITLHNTLFHHYATYQEPEGGLAYRPSGSYKHHEWNGLRHTDGSVELNFRGCAVDTDGRGAYRHPEDRTRQTHTSLRLSNGQSLDTDRENFFVLPPSVAKAYGIRKGDLGWLVQDRTGKAVPVVFGDSGPENKLGEASVHALKSLGFDVNGRCGVEKNEGFRVVFMPQSGDGSGDIAGNPEEMARRLSQISGTRTSLPT